MKLFIALILGCQVASRAALVFNPFVDFSISDNPNGVWTYGYSQTLGGELTLLKSSTAAIMPVGPFGTGLDAWWTNTVPPDPLIVRNPNNATFTSFTSVVPAGGLAMHPGQNGEFAVLRFTAPSDASYRIAGGFSGDNNVPTTTDAHVVVNGQSIFDADVNAFGPASLQPFDETHDLKRGDVVDFAVGIGSNGDFRSDLTGLDLTITELKVFDVRSDFSASTNPNDAWTYGYSGTLGGLFNPFTGTGTRNGIDFWIDPNIGIDPWIGKNPATTARLLNDIVFQPQRFMMHPGPSGEYATLRWTAPNAGEYFVQTVFTGEGASASVDVHVSHLAQTLFDGAINGRAQKASYMGIVDVGSGDTIDFAVGFGADQNYQFDATGVDVIVRPIAAISSTNLVVHGAIELTWPVDSGNVFKLQAAPKVDAAVWQDVGTPFPATDNRSNLFERITSPALFYRLITYK